MSAALLKITLHNPYTNILGPGDKIRLMNGEVLTVIEVNGSMLTCRRSFQHWRLVKTIILLAAALLAFALAFPQHGH